jgi:hypothetical protein
MKLNLVDKKRIYEGLAKLYIKGRAYRQAKENYTMRELVIIANEIFGEGATFNEVTLRKYIKRAKSG